MSEERKHHTTSPSTLQNREACPGYEGRESQHERTIAGTLAHKVAETGKDDAALSDKDAAAAAECLDFIAKRKSIMEEQRAKMAEQNVPQVLELKEVYLPIDDCKFDDADCTTGGFVDTILIDCTEQYAEMADWKFGIWPVENASNNLQAIAYVLGAFKKFSKLETIRFFFRQPHIDYYTDALFTRAQVPELYLRVQVVVHRAREARRKIAAGDWSGVKPYIPVCNFCARIGTCPAVLSIACKVGAKFHPAEIPADITPSMVLEKEQTLLGLRLAQVVQVWAAAFRTQTTDRILRGGAVLPDGYILTSASRRELVDKE